ncbi:MAG: DNA polymerase III subunit epsilon [Variovorax sp.]
MTRQIVLDTETTGLSAENGDRVIEIGCVELHNRKLTGRNLHFYVNPGRDSHEDALKVHGISNEFLRDKPKFTEVAKEVVDYLSGAELIIHNAAFDVGFLDMELALAGHPPLAGFAGVVTDTLALAKSMYPGKRNSLDALCDRLEVDNSNRTLHGALRDAELLADVYIRLTRGQNALLIDGASDDDEIGAAVLIDLRAFTLPVLLAGPAECVAHETVLLQIDASSAGRTVYRQLTGSAVA